MIVNLRKPSDKIVLYKHRVIISYNVHCIITLRIAVCTCTVHCVHVLYIVNMYNNNTLVLPLCNTG